jgi:hypothetical protein
LKNIMSTDPIGFELRCSVLMTEYSVLVVSQSV